MSKKKSRSKEVRISFYTLLWGTLGVMLLLEPGTNALNLERFGTIKLLVFLSVCLGAILILIAPFFAKVWRKKLAEKYYIFHFIIFLPTISFYLFKAIDSLLR